MDLMYDVIDLIVNQETDILVSKYHDHALTGNWKGYRELHIMDDWLLIYLSKQDEVDLVLVRTGTYDRLFQKSPSFDGLFLYYNMG